MVKITFDYSDKTSECLVMTDTEAVSELKKFVIVSPPCDGLFLLPITPPFPLLIAIDYTSTHPLVLSP